VEEFFAVKAYSTVNYTKLPNFFPGRFFMLSESNKTLDTIINYSAMFLFSFVIIALEMIYFHLLMNVTIYIKATFIIAVAMLGIAIGSVTSFYLLKIRHNMVMLVSAVLFFVSVILSYYNIIYIGKFTYPVLLILPFIFGSIIVAQTFAKAHSNPIYFTNLVGSALGVVYPIFFVSLMKSENAIALLMFVPVLFLGILAWTWRRWIIRIPILVVAITGIIAVTVFLQGNMALPEKIATEEFETEIMAKVEKDLDSANSGVRDRAGYDKRFLDRVYSQTPDGSHYVLGGDQYDQKRAKYLLNQLGYLDDVNILFDVSTDESFKGLYKIYNNGQRVLFSEDNLMGRIELLGDDDYMNMAVNGVILDGIDSYNGNYYDPRVPAMKDAEMFIIGLSADGIVKSCHRQNPKYLGGIEINPIILRIMQEDGQFANFARRPYDGVDVYWGEGRSFLESSERQYDLISLMNIHMEHGPVSTLSPEFFHTVEATRMLLSRLTDRGIVCYEEIVLNERSRYAYYKILNTIVEAMKQSGVENPADNIVSFHWDFWGGTAFRTIMIKRVAFSEEEKKWYRGWYDTMDSKGWYKTMGMLTFPGEIHDTREVELIEKGNLFEGYALPFSVTIDEYESKLIPSLKGGLDDVALMNKHYYKNTRYGKYYQRYSYTRLNIPHEEEMKLGAILEPIGYAQKLDLAPVTDDKPFPYNIYEDKSEVWDIMRVILLMSLFLFIPVIILMVVHFRSYKLKVAPSILFMALSGLGYMLTEIVLMQQYQQFIGNPMYALIVTLGGLLFFSGIGSFVSRWFPKKVLIIAIALIPVILLLKLLFLDSVFEAFASFGFISKIVISTLLLMPLTFLMGIPFPHVVETVKKQITNEYGTLMFGISGAFSSIAATLSILLSVMNGFSMSYIVGLICYIFVIGLFVYIKRAE
jgi:spermidine synthase